MTENACPLSKCEIHFFLKNVKTCNKKQKSNISQVEYSIDEALYYLGLGDVDKVDSSLFVAEAFIKEAEIGEIEPVDAKEYDTYPMNLRKAITENYVNRDICERLRGRIGNIKKIRNR